MATAATSMSFREEGSSQEIFDGEGRHLQNTDAEENLGWGPSMPSGADEAFKRIQTSVSAIHSTNYALIAATVTAVAIAGFGIVGARDALSFYGGSYFAAGHAGIFFEHDNLAPPAAIAGMVVQIPQFLWRATQQANLLQAIGAAALIYTAGYKRVAIGTFQATAIAAASSLYFESNFVVRSISMLAAGLGAFDFQSGPSAELSIIPMGMGFFATLATFDDLGLIGAAALGGAVASTVHSIFKSAYNLFPENHHI